MPSADVSDASSEDSAGRFVVKDAKSEDMASAMDEAASEG